MSVRRQTANRLTLFRTCGTCGKQIVTTADTPWVRQVERDGKRQATTYFCSEGCFAASYKHIGWFDGKAEERRKLKDRNRDPEKERGAEPGIPAGPPGGAAGKGTAAPPHEPRPVRRRQRLRPAQAQAESGGGAG